MNLWKESLLKYERWCKSKNMGKCVAIIPARAGSKGIINKNIIDFCNKPLIGWSIGQAKKSKCVDEVYVSTDGEEIASISKQFGAKVIWRPKEIANDIASSEEALIHAMDVIEKCDTVNRVVFLQATSPIRKSDDIDKAMSVFESGNYDSLFSMSILEDYCIWKEGNGQINSWSYDYRARGRRQERERLYLENGSIYIFTPEILRKNKNRLGGKIGMYEMPFNQSYEIDSVEDILICEFFMKKCLEREEK